MPLKEETNKEKLSGSVTSCNKVGSACVSVVISLFCWVTSSSASEDEIMDVRNIAIMTSKVNIEIVNTAFLLLNSLSLMASPIS